VSAAIDISTEGDVTDEDRARVVKAVRSVIGTAGDPVLHVSIRLRHAADPAQERPAKARATIDLDGEPVRAHASGTTMSEAIDRLDQRLRDRIRHLAAHRRAVRRRGPESPPGEWRHGDWDPPRPQYFPRPVDERSIVRHKASSPVEATLDEAVFDLEAMDHDFLLFQDLATGSDAVVSRVEGGSYAVQYLDAPDADRSAEGVAAIDIDRRPVPELSLDGAREHLDLTEVPWVFHRDSGTRRGAVLYRRDDGHYGWIGLAVDGPSSKSQG
jgi:ribosome-associated translation inhibitor RaiA